MTTRALLAAFQAWHVKVKDGEYKQSILDEHKVLHKNGSLIIKSHKRPRLSTKELVDLNKSNPTLLKLEINRQINCELFKLMTRNMERL